MLESLLLVQGKNIPPAPKPDITFKTSGTSATTITTSQLGSGFTTEYSIDGADFSPAGASFVIPAGDHEVTLKLDVTTGTVLSMEPFKGILTEVTDWEDFQLPNIRLLNCTRLTKVPEQPPVAITNMTQMFKGCSSFNQDISQWNVSNVTNMGFMFNNCSAFNQDIGSWDVSQVTDIHYMFYNCSSFNQDISNWDTSNVTNMSGMFYNCYSFNQDIGNWDTGNVTDMSGMFGSCSVFNQDISGWDVGKVTDISDMFYLCRSFNQDLSSMVFKWSVRRDNYDTGTTAWNAAYRPKFTG